MRILGLILLLASLSTATTSRVFSQEKTSVVGKVVDVRGDAMGGLDIIVRLPGGKTINQVRTGVKGEFEFYLEPGDYYLECSIQGRHHILPIKVRAKGLNVIVMVRDPVSKGGDL